MTTKPRNNAHIVLTSHPTGHQNPVPIRWGAASAAERGPVVGTLGSAGRRNAIGAHSGSYALYRALAVAAGSLSPLHKPDLTNTSPAEAIGPHGQWGDPDKIVSIDPWGHLVSEQFAGEIESGLDIRPTIAVTKARLTIAELKNEIHAGRLKPDGRILLDSGEVNVTKIAIEPVWYLPGVARRFSTDEGVLRRTRHPSPDPAAWFAAARRMTTRGADTSWLVQVIEQLEARSGSA